MYWDRTTRNLVCERYLLHRPVVGQFPINQVTVDTARRHVLIDRSVHFGIDAFEEKRLGEDLVK